MAAGIVYPGATLKRQGSTLNEGRLDLEVTLLDRHIVVNVGGVVGIEHLFICAYALVELAASCCRHSLVGHRSEVVLINETLNCSAKLRVLLVIELLGIVHLDGHFSRHDLVIANEGARVVASTLDRHLDNAGDVGEVDIAVILVIFVLDRVVLVGLKLLAVILNRRGPLVLFAVVGDIDRAINIQAELLIGVLRIGLRLGVGQALLVNNQLAVGHLDSDVVVLCGTLCGFEVALGEAHRIGARIDLAHDRAKNSRALFRSHRSHRGLHVSDAHIGRQISDILNSKASCNMSVSIVGVRGLVALNLYYDIGLFDGEATINDGNGGFVIGCLFAGQLKLVLGETHGVRIGILAFSLRASIGLQGNFHAFRQGGRFAVGVLHDAGKALYRLSFTIVGLGLRLACDFDSKLNALHGQISRASEFHTRDGLGRCGDRNISHALLSARGKIGATVLFAALVDPLINNIELGSDVRVVRAQDVQENLRGIERLGRSVVIVRGVVDIKLDPTGIQVVVRVIGLGVDVHLLAGNVSVAVHGGLLVRPPPELVSRRGAHEGINALDGVVAIINDRLGQILVSTVICPVDEVGLGVGCAENRS